MKILYTLDSGIIGGMELHVNNLVEAMIKENHKVFVWCRKGSISEYFKKSGAQVFYKKIAFDICPRYIISLRRFLKKEHIDIVHAHELKAGANTLIAAFLAGTPVKITHTHTPISEWQVPNKLKKFITYFTIKFYARLVNMFSTKEIALTESRKKAKMSEGIKENKLEIIPNGVNTQKFDISHDLKKEYRNQILARYNMPPDAFVIGNIGRITEEKGHAVLLEAFSRFFTTLNDGQKEKTYLFFGGGGHLQDEITALAEKLQTSDNLIITGVFEEEDQVKFYSTLDLFVFPSLAEGFGLVLIEAMSSKIPVICSDLPVLKEVGSDTVCYFKRGDVNDLQNKISMFYKGKIGSLKEKAFERVESEYSLESFGRNYLNLYRELLKI